METLNKNWFAFTLVAVIFTCLGYFFGIQATSQHCSAKEKQASCKMSKGSHHSMSLSTEEILDNEEMEIEETTGDNGEKIIKVKVNTNKE